ncbi:sce7726 family protein [Paenibacillus donghaensis]|uniref:Sce7726 family protein n=1 Tax=Paenibacillus donghaensis TaxID=414771 RepID=A0A2Z2KUF4_9BACL|nr:sce7726 family protein [Paenibacillus donghaensis]ASA23368.1 hypothetical protein B9T62_22710 [Paenibacillus donghaensis]
MLVNDQYVRAMLINELKINHGNDLNTRIINELGIDFGASRVDVAVVNGIIHGYEIKSDKDNLNRLPRQISFYNRLFQRMTIVSSRKYYEPICEMVPEWWGIKIISADSTRLIEKRKGRLQNNQDKELLLRLLWKKDLEGLVDFLSLPKKIKNLKKNQLLEIFSQEADLNLLREYTYQALKNRPNWRKEL